MNSKLPVSFKPYFWDTNFEGLSPEKSSYFIIKRVLDRGDTKAIKWLKSNYSNDQLREVLIKTKDLSRPTGNFWADILQLDKSKIPSLTRPYSPRLQRSWRNSFEANQDYVDRYM